MDAQVFLYKMAEYNVHSWPFISIHRYGGPTIYLLKKKICVLSGLAQLKLMLFKGPLNMNVAGG